MPPAPLAGPQTALQRVERARIMKEESAGYWIDALTAARTAGHSLAEIAKAGGVSRQAVLQITQRHEPAKRKPSPRSATHRPAPDETTPPDEATAVAHDGNVAERGNT